MLHVYHCYRHTHNIHREGHSDKYRRAADGHLASLGIIGAKTLLYLNPALAYRWLKVSLSFDLEEHCGSQNT